MPKGWSRPGTVKTGKTMRDLKMIRKNEGIPHPSFDVDGDGQVSQKDYFIAKHFDKDRDGRLNTEELSTARKALKDGYESKFLFGLEAGANRLSAYANEPGFDYEKRHS